MAFHGILACYRDTDRWFGGVTCAHGAGSARGGAFAACTGKDMGAIRRQEQNTAATIGEYGAMLQLGIVAFVDAHIRQFASNVRDLLHRHASPKQSEIRGRPETEKR